MLMLPLQHVQKHTISSLCSCWLPSHSSATMACCRVGQGRAGWRGQDRATWWVPSITCCKQVQVMCQAFSAALLIELTGNECGHDDLRLRPGQSQAVVSDPNSSSCHMHNMHEVVGNKAVVAIRIAYWMHACCVLVSPIPLLGGCAVCIAYGTMLLMLLCYGVSDMSVHESQVITCNVLGTCSSCICHDPDLGICRMCRSQQVCKDFVMACMVAKEEPLTRLTVG